MAENQPDLPDRGTSQTDGNRPERRSYTGEEVSQGEIILRTPLRKAVFLGGLVAMVLIAVILGIIAVAF